MKTTHTLILSLFLGVAITNAKTLKIASPDWDEALALSQLAANLLEEEFGYTVEINSMGASDSFKAVAAGEQDLFLNAWLPFTVHESSEDIETAVQAWIDANPKLVKVWTKRGFSLF